MTLSRWGSRGSIVWGATLALTVGFAVGEWANPEDGYLAFWFDPKGPREPVKVFHSAELPNLWTHLDWFEGRDWPRTQVPVELADGRRVVANLYQRVGKPT